MADEKVSCWIPGYQLQGGGQVEGKPYTEFELQIEVGSAQYIRYCRYSAFRDLHKELYKSHKNLPFPSRRIVGNNQNARFLESRRLGLEQFFQEVLNLSPVPPSVWTFLQIDVAKSEETNIPCIAVFNQRSNAHCSSSVINGVKAALFS